jgi:transcriptional regulator with XRE-family HTH domain
MAHVMVNEQLIYVIRSCSKSQREISRETGITSSTISRFVSGKRTINDQIFSDLCEYFELELKPRTTSSD